MFLFTGLAMITSMPAIGMLAGAALVSDGINGLSQEIIKWVECQPYENVR
ncbi:hypothetical protein M2422_004427 [Enterobacter sp. SLBN-59]|nr:hypothetical protein [Enterobacter sp. SLBN-59]